MPYKQIKLNNCVKKRWDQLGTNHCYAQRCKYPGKIFQNGDDVVIKHKVPRGAVRHYHPECSAALNIVPDPPSPHTPLPPIIQINAGIKFNNN